MYFIYNTFINILILFSPLILFFRILKRKEDPKRLLEKFCLYKNKQNIQKLIWFHAASVGELKSIIPIIEIIEKKNQIVVYYSTIFKTTLKMRHTQCNVNQIIGLMFNFLFLSKRQCDTTISLALQLTKTIHFVR